MNNLTILSCEQQQIIELLSVSHLNPQLCDSPVPYMDTVVPAGTPLALGDYDSGQYIVLPRSFIGWHPMCVIDVVGDSMREAGILPGDHLQVELTQQVSDGDIVVACIDGECTVKAYCRDEHGQQWLVPRNDAYNPIPLTEDMNVQVLARVVSNMRDAPRVSYSDMLRTIRRSRSRDADADRQPCRSAVESAIVRVAPSVEHGRQWYAVYRALVDHHAHDEGDYAGFVSQVLRLVPSHAHLPVAKELGRMAVQSFRKPVALWESADAPVSGQRFYDYLRIARLTADALG